MATTTSPVQRQEISRQELMLAGAAHELRTPLTVARGHMELLRREAPSAELEVALEELERLERVVARILLVCELETLSLRPSPVELRPLLERVAAARPSVRIEPAPRAFVAGDEATLLLALDELLANALQRSTEPAEVALAGRRLGREVVISVTDGGPGIDAASAERLFDCFARGDDGRCRTGGGAGLGLAIVRAVAAAHGGECGVRNRAAGRGAIWSLRLPASDAH